MKQRILLLAAVFAALLLAPCSLLAQGALTPPGAPAPLFKTLTQVEPRIPVQTLAGDGSSVFLITNSGSYYLTGNVTGAVGKAAIAIAADNVTLDLGGHSLLGMSNATIGVELRGARTQVAIRHGHIRDFNNSGIQASGAQNHLLIEDVSVRRITGQGILAASSASMNVLVRNCTVSGTGLTGIQLTSARGTVERCVVMDCSSAGSIPAITAAVVTGCEVEGVSCAGVGPAYGILAQLVADCLVTSVTNTGSGSSIGISAPTVKGCQVSSVTSGTGPATGISGGTVVQGCTISTVNSTGAGDGYGIIGVNVSGCRVDFVNNTSANAGASTGINGTTVHDCQVSTIGGPASLATSTGIQGFNVSGSSVNGVGVTNASAGATGIQGSTGGLVTASTVSTVNGGNFGSATGIAGSVVADCSVSSVTMPAGGSGVCLGISAETISGCRVANLISSSATNVVGLNNYRLARDCSVAIVTSLSTGQAYGCLTTSAGRTERVNVFGVDDVGISVVSGHTVTDCNTTAGNTAILATGTRNVIDGNNIAGSSITGIMVSNLGTNAHALVIRNQVRNCTTNFTLNLPCQVGPVISASGTIAAGANPWANFTD